MATAEMLAARVNDAAEWIDLVLESATRPVAATEPERSPLDARKDDELGAYKVIRVLGHGASSRVLEVEHEDGHYALKVSLGPDRDQRLTAEAAVLARLRHPRIVRIEETLTIAGRPCLLMSLAGQSLQRELVEHGTPSTPRPAAEPRRRREGRRRRADPVARARPRARCSEDRRHGDPRSLAGAVDMDPEGVDRRAAGALACNHPAAVTGAAGRSMQRRSCR